VALPLILAAAPAHGPGSIGAVLLGLALVLVGAKVLGEVAERLGQPAVLGELLFGLLLGMLSLFYANPVSSLVGNDAFTLLAELGAILLLFQVGLESTRKEMMAVGGRALAVAVAGVVTPMVLGYGVGELMRPQESWMLKAFLGSMLAATSVGITARVLKDAGALRTPFARIILGAAVIDDILGLLVLAVVSGIITAAATGQALALGAIILIMVKAVVFLVGALVLGSLFVPGLFRSGLVFRSAGVVQALSLSFCFLLSYLALVAGLAPIVGAFAAGLVLEELHFEGHVQRGERPLRQTLEPLTALLVPVFFVRMGMLVDMRSFTSPSVLGFAVLLTLTAIAGKLACGLVTPPGVSRLTVGLGMMPRGEVGLIFASIGAGLMLYGRPVIDAGAYAAAVFMVVATTMAAPPALSWAMRRDRAASESHPAA
jgi:Kef-type K+ transport system membrane component KefB